MFDYKSDYVSSMICPLRKNRQIFDKIVENCSIYNVPPG